MRHGHLLISLLAIVLSSCKTDPYAGDENQKVKLKKDTHSNYVFDEDVTNENGSMSYEIFVRSFYDSDGDGIGDLNGVTLKLPYLQEMGIKTVWLMPINPSPSYHGYDVKDYYDIHPDYGTINDLDNLVSEANKSNIDIMMDMVLNHSSRSHPAFRQSYNDYINNNEGADSKKDWYHWSTTNIGAKYGDLYYECGFGSDMPDFNLDSTSLRAEIDNICKFWIQDHGIKGFRLDAVYHYYNTNTAKNVAFLNWLDSTVKKYNPNFYMVGEAWIGDSVLTGYSASTMESFFKFDNATGGDKSLVNVAKGFNATNIFNSMYKYESNIKKNNPKAYSSYFLSNHDQDRISKNFNEIQNKLAASILGLLPGTSFMYYGEEIQLVGTRTTGMYDDGTDVKRRLPLIWSKNDKTGECSFPQPERKDLDNVQQVELGINDQLKRNYSLLNHYKKVINVRNKYPFIKNGLMTSAQSLLDTDLQSIIAYKIEDQTTHEYIIVVHNLSEYNMEVAAPGTQIVDEINTSRRVPEIKNGKLRIGRYSTVVIK